MEVEDAPTPIDEALREDLVREDRQGEVWADVRGEILPPTALNQRDLHRLRPRAKRSGPGGLGDHRDDPIKAMGRGGHEPCPHANGEVSLAQKHDPFGGNVGHGRTIPVGPQAVT